MSAAVAGAGVSCVIVTSSCPTGTAQPSRTSRPASTMVMICCFALCGCEIWSPMAAASPDGAAGLCVIATLPCPSCTAQTFCTSFTASAGGMFCGLCITGSSSSSIMMRRLLTCTLGSSIEILAFGSAVSEMLELVVLAAVAVAVS